MESLLASIWVFYGHALDCTMPLLLLTNDQIKFLLLVEAANTDFHHDLLGQMVRKADAVIYRQHRIGKKR